MSKETAHSVASQLILRTLHCSCNPKGISTKKITNWVYFWLEKKIFQNAKKFLWSLLGVKNTSPLDTCGCDFKKHLTCSNRLPTCRQEEVFWKLFTYQNGRFCFTSNPQVSKLFRLTISISPGLHFLVCNRQNQTQQTEMLKKDVNSTTETRKWASHLPP